MKMWRRRLAGQRRSKGQDGQSLLETAISMPLLLGLAINIINWGYLWFMVLALSAAPRMGAQYATQGGAAGTGTAPGPTTISNLVYDKVINAGTGIGCRGTANGVRQVVINEIADRRGSGSRSRACRPTLGGVLRAHSGCSRKGQHHKPQVTPIDDVEGEPEQ